MRTFLSVASMLLVSVPGRGRRRRAVEWFRYPKAGEGRRSMELHAYDVAAKVRTRLDLGDRDQYIFGLGWLPDGTAYLFLSVSRDAKVMEVRAYRPAGGGIGT